MSSWVEISKAITVIVVAAISCIQLWVLIRDKTTINKTVASWIIVARRNALPFGVCAIGGAGLVWAATWPLSPASVFVSVLCGVLVAIGFMAALVLEVALLLDERPAGRER